MNLVNGSHDYSSLEPKFRNVSNGNNNNNNKYRYTYIMYLYKS